MGGGSVSVMNNEYWTGYEVKEENKCTINREHGELIYGRDSKHPTLFTDINNM